MVTSMLMSCLPGAVGIGIAMWVIFVGVVRLSVYLVVVVVSVVSFMPAYSHLFLIVDWISGWSFFGCCCHGCLVVLL